MKCRLTEKKNITIMLIAGLAMMVVGAAAGYLLPEEAHMLTTLAGMLSGVGTSFAVIGGVVLLRRKRLGEKRAKDSELIMTDERGMAVAYKAQNVAAIVAVIGIVAIMLVALFRGDELYMILGTALCFILAFAKLIAWYVYNRIM